MLLCLLGAVLNAVQLYISKLNIKQSLNLLMHCKHIEFILL